MNTTKQGAEAARKENIHEEQTALIFYEREIKFRTGNGRSPRVLVNLVHGKGPNLCSTK